MASRLPNSQVCLLAKTAIQQAKESINPLILRPASREVPIKECSRNIKGDSNVENDKFRSRDSSCLIHRKISETNLTHKQLKSNASNYITSCRSNRSTVGNNDNEKVLHHRSVSCECPKVTLTHTDIPKFSIDKVDANFAKVHNSIPFSEVSTEPGLMEIDTASSARGRKCWYPCYTDILKENMKRKLENRVISGKTRGRSDRLVDDSKLLSSRNFEPKIFGSNFNISSLTGCQYLRGHFVNLRSLTDVVHSNGIPCKNSTRKNIKKNSSSKLCKEKSKINVWINQLKDVSLKPLRRGNYPKEPIKCIKKKKEEPCKRSDDDWKLEAKPLEVIPCPLKISKQLPMKSEMPIKRMKKFVIPEPRKSHEIIEEYCTRADDSSAVAKKNLPNISSCNDKIVMAPVKFSEMVPLKTPVRINDPEIPAKISTNSGCSYVCRIDDEDLVPEKKSLAKIPALQKSQSLTQTKQSTPIKRLEKCEISEPMKSCGIVEQICYPRSDDNLEELRKKLPKIPSGNISKEIPELKEIPLRRLKKVEVSEPPKVCPPPICPEDCFRADKGMVSPKKKLPVLTTPVCPCLQNPYAFKEQPNLKRLKAIDVKEPPKVCPPPICPDDCYRADKGIVSPKKTFPVLTPSVCPCPQNLQVFKEQPHLKRLKAMDVKEPPKVCPPPICPDDCYRADKGIVSPKKTFPVLTPSVCPCPQNLQVFQEQPHLKRLEAIDVKEPPKVCPPPICPDDCYRADKGMVSPRKKFPVFTPQVFPCPQNPYALKEQPSLKRLKAMDVMEPPKVCPPPICPEDCFRADKGMVATKKMFPVLTPSVCPCPKFPYAFKEQPSLKRLKAMDVMEPPKVCPPPICPEDCFRADKGMVATKKMFPVLTPSVCPCPKFPYAFKEQPSLKRLKAMDVMEPPKVCPPPICPEDCFRADKGMVAPKKMFPVLTPSVCPCPQNPYEFKEQPRLKRLEAHDVKEPPKVCPPPICPDDCYRADKGTVAPKKTFPVLTPSVCPCPQNPNLFKEQPRFKRLKAMDVKEPPKVCPPPICPEDCYRADKGMVVTKKTLPIIAPSVCPYPQNPYVFKDCDNSEIQRLPKVSIKVPEKICPAAEVKKCERVIPHSGNQKLPKIKISTKICEIKEQSCSKRLVSRTQNTKECSKENVVQKSCSRSDPISWCLSLDNKKKNYAQQKNSRCVRSKRSMSTNLTEHYTKGLLKRKMQLSHIDVRKRLSYVSFGKSHINLLKHNAKSDSHLRKFSDDKKDLQPNVPLYKKFTGVEEIKPEAPNLDPEKEDECVRSKYNIPKESKPITCEDRNPKRNYLRANAKKVGFGSSNLENCSDVMKRCSTTSKDSKGCPTDPPTDETSCPPTFRSEPPQTNSDCVPVQSRDSAPTRVCVSPPTRSCEPSSSRSCDSDLSRSCGPPTRSCEPPATCSRDSDLPDSCDPPTPFCDTPPSRSCEPRSTRSRASSRTRSCEPPPPQGQKICRPSAPCEPARKCSRTDPKLSLWQRMKSYFKAKPNCPTPADMKRKKAIKKLKKIADQTGMGVYDPCDDPRKICKEVERRCCLAKRSQCLKKRCFHCYGSPRSCQMLSLHYSPKGLLQVSNINLLENYFIPFYKHLMCRTISNWRNPFEFYEMEDIEERVHDMNKTKSKKMVPYAGKNILNSSKTHIFNLDAISEIMCRYLKLQPEELNESFRMNLHYLLEFSPECLEKKRDILIDILNAICKDMKLRKNDNFEEAGKYEPTYHILPTVQDYNMQVLSGLSGGTDFSLQYDDVLSGAGSSEGTYDVYQSSGSDFQPSHSESDNDSDEDIDQSSQLSECENAQMESETKDKHKMKTHSTFDIDSREILNNEKSITTRGTKRIKTFPIKPKNSKIRIRNPDSWKRRAAKLCRDKGQSYTSSKGNIVAPKTICSGCLCTEKCRLKCSTKFSDDKRKLILDDFHNLDVNTKNALLFRCITPQTVARVRKNAVKHKSHSYKYSLVLDNQQIYVCKKAFCALYQISRKKVDVIKTKLETGQSAPSPDKRGRHMNRPHKISDAVEQAIISHINKFPTEESHYSRNSNPHKRYLSPNLNMSLMYRLYIEDCKEQNMPNTFLIKKSTYSRIFSTKFNLSFSSPKSDTCSRCDSGQSNEEHKENVKLGFDLMSKDRGRALIDKNECYITVDLQQTMPLPKITTSKAFYLRQIWFYNLGIHCITTEGHQSVMQTWTEDIASRGSAEVVSCLWNFAQTCENAKTRRKLTIWSDSCSDTEEKQSDQLWKLTNRNTRNRR